jgi:Mrp family chromosome partitioning ATPase
MSRNFELLQRAELERKQAVPNETTTMASPAGAAAAPVAATINIPCDARSRISPSDIGPEVFDLVQRLFLLPNDWTPHCVTFFSLSGASDGSSVCARAAEALSAHSTGTVCVVDANFNAPTMHVLYSIKNSVGFSEALIQTEPLESYAHQVQESNLTVIPAGSNLLAWKSALASEAARKRLADLRSRFDYVLIEAPATSTISSAVMLSQLADGAVVVVEANDTRREVARNAVDELIAANVRVLGAVLNNRRFPIPERLYRVL